MVFIVEDFYFIFLDFISSTTIFFLFFFFFLFIFFLILLLRFLLIFLFLLVLLILLFLLFHLFSNFFYFFLFQVLYYDGQPKEKNTKKNFINEADYHMEKKEDIENNNIPYSDMPDVNFSSSINYIPRVTKVRQFDFFVLTCDINIFLSFSIFSLRNTEYSCFLTFTL